MQLRLTDANEPEHTETWPGILRARRHRSQSLSRVLVSYEQIGYREHARVELRGIKVSGREGGAHRRSLQGEADLLCEIAP